MKFTVILLAATGLVSIGAEAQARQVYCYARQMDVSTSFLRNEEEKLSRGFSPTA
jgi:hypothetical protein